MERLINAENLKQRFAYVFGSEDDLKYCKELKDAMFQCIIKVIDAEATAFDRQEVCDAFEKAAVRVDGDKYRLSIFEAMEIVRKE